MKLDLTVQIALETAGLPPEAELRRWTTAALAGAGYRQPAEVVIRIVDEAESASLNQTYRHKPGPTNVLSFPFTPPPGVTFDLLGDIVICAPVAAREAVEQGKPAAAHWAHLVSHGVLHLLGYDHQNPDQATDMERLETRILRELGYPDPYAEAEPQPSSPDLSPASGRGE